jgi:hypothetical protein
MSIFTLTKQMLVAGLIFAGGLKLANAADLFGSDLKPDNIFRASAVLPPDLKRVVVLPLAHDESRAELAPGCEMLDPVLQAELIKTKKFEVVPVGAEALESLTELPSWTGSEILPAKFFDSLKRVYGCDAVLFCQLTTYQPYAPLAVGWRMKLVDVSTQKIIWAGDMIYDADNAVVAKDAREFQKQQQGSPPAAKKIFNFVSNWIYHGTTPATEDQWIILTSPRLFGEYSAVKLLQTLPER